MTPPPPPSAPNPQLATLPVLSFTDDKVGETFLDLKSALPDTARGVVHRAIIHDLQNKCRGTASTLTRAKVGGGGRKPYPQKKTGRAREGELGLHSDPAKESCSVHSHRFPNWLRSRITSHIDIDGFKHNNILPAPVAAFILSTGMKLDMQNNEKTMNHVITSDWIQLDGLKHIYVSLYNAGTRLYQNKELYENHPLCTQPPLWKSAHLSWLMSTSTCYAKLKATRLVMVLLDASHVSASMDDIQVNDGEE